MKSVARRVVDGAMLHLIKMWLEAPVEETDEHGRKHRSTRNRDEGRGTPQGAPVATKVRHISSCAVGCDGYAIGVGANRNSSNYGVGGGVDDRNSVVVTARVRHVSACSVPAPRSSRRSDHRK